MENIGRYRSLMKLVSLIIVFILVKIFVYAQHVKIENTDLDISSNKVIVSYDLLAPDTSKWQNIELFFVDEHFTVKVPEKISGDFGPNVKPGINKKIEWDVFKDDIAVAQKLMPKIVVNGINKGGSINTIYSILIPGLGDYFVKNHRDMLIKPYVRTISTLGVLSLGIVAMQNREKSPIINTQLVYEQYDSNNNGHLNVNDEYRWVEKELIIGTRTDHWLFNNDAELLLSLGITMWIADIIWVFVKGNENEKLKIFSNYSLNANRSNGLTSLRVTVSF